ncbi:sugar phosphate isomerase/epimerase [Lewinella aquimaris]|uniref:Sugar phosphate isomerase/epimerase n=1 Tax=Neolewinella aquimaris TaxID=1835722 RepID=A0A840E786_9BACT|nr:sugar phosphate isomerase/epimerase family protein [Neolewinella aquimaris]MBB4079813.1 sugar phosphate isomerase/epimerase [Neolewinella aquimaris]
MQLGFVTAILPDQSLEEVLRTAADIGYDCVEVMCWPPGKAERRYAGVTHIDISTLDEAGIERVKELQERYGVFISSLGYYPNVLGGDAGAAQVAIDHLYDLLEAAAALGINTVTTFVGRDKDRTIEAQWEDFLTIWKPLVERAGELGVRIGIENCPMRFTADEWPGGNNLAVSPDVWENMWRDIPAAHWGLNYDPSHLVLMQMDYTRPFRDYPERMIHVHAKDLRIDREKLDRHGIFSHPGLWHTPKLPGMGDVDWGKFFSHLTDAGYRGPVCVEVEDRAYEGDLELRKRSLRQSHDYLRQFIA